MKKIIRRCVGLILTASLVFTAMPQMNASAGVPVRLDVPNFRQDWEPWKAQLLGESSNEIQMAGCALTSLSMVLKYYGVDTDPGRLNQWLKDNSGFMYGSAIVWSKAAEMGSGIQYIGKQDFEGDADLERIKSEIDSGYPVIARMGYQGTSHYAVICGYQGDTFYLNDPWYEDPGHTIDRVVKQGDLDVKYDDNESPQTAIKGIVVFRTENTSPPKVPVVNVRSIFDDYPNIMVHPIKMPVIEMRIGDPDMFSNNVRKKIDLEGNVSPQIIDGRTLVPIRAIIEELGGQVEWNEQDKKVVLRVQGRTLEIWIGKRTAYNNKWYFEFDVVPQIIEGRTILPLRIIAEQLGCNVEWEETMQKITLSGKR